MSKSSKRLIKYIQTAIDQEIINKAELIRRSGITRQVIDRYLAEEITPGMEAADKLADALGRPLESILTEAAPKQVHSPHQVWQRILNRLAEMDEDELRAFADKLK